MLLDGKGHEFLEFYYEYVDMIYNKQVPIGKIANKARVKQSVQEYKIHVNKRTKSGSLMSRQAHMELLLHNNVSAGLGDTVYYVNNGQRKSHGDVVKKGDSVTINCYLVNEKDIEMNPNLLGEYNVPRYLASFNKRIEPLLVVFKEEVREQLLVTNPEDRGFFTKDQSELISGVPFEEGDQDSIDDLLTLSEGELKYWEKRGINPNYIYDLAEPGWEEHIDLVK
jgi:hypothetical protein